MDEICVIKYIEIFRKIYENIYYKIYIIRKYKCGNIYIITIYAEYNEYELNVLRA